MSKLLRRMGYAMTALGATLLPAFAAAAGQRAQENAGGVNVLVVVGMLILFLLLSVLLSRMWVGVMNVSLLDEEPISSIEKRHPFLPSFRIILATIFGTGLLLFFTVRTFGTIAPFEGTQGVKRAAVFFGSALAVSIILLITWKRAKEFVFAFSLGTLVSFILIGFERTLLDASTQPDAFFMALGVVGIAIAWRFLFGPWMPHIKATVLGTFIFWIVFHMLWQESPVEFTAHILAILIALVPAVVWCLLFLRYHKERLTVVLLMFFSGMISTAPILFYDLLVRRGVELQFFLFKIVPENFSRSSSAFVSGSIGSSATSLQATLLSNLFMFLIVGLIEEGSKGWVLKKSGKEFFRSINDVVELGIIAAIGFAFAENVLNPVYFVGFIRQYLMTPASADWGEFFGNVVGRSILTTMVHIVSTGVLGYFMGLSIFAGPYLEEARMKGKTTLIGGVAQLFLRIPEKEVFRKQVMITGLSIAVILHGMFNFLVSLPDILPGNPRTLGDLFGMPESVLSYFSIILIPSLLYVLGGFWILSELFFRSENDKDRGQLVVTDTFIRTQNPVAM